VRENLSPDVQVRLGAVLRDNNYEIAARRSTMVWCDSASTGSRR